MNRRLSSDAGISIIETTVVLSVMFILAGAMSPIISESMTTARAVRAKNDASMIAMGLVNFQRDVGADALSFGEAGPVSEIRLPDVLVTQGAEPSIVEPDSTPDSLAVLTRGGSRGGAIRQVSRGWLEAATGLIDDLLITNRVGYRMRQPGEYGGWNGPYLAVEVKGDPWGNRYMVNTAFLDGGTTPTDSQGRPRRAVFVISAGANGRIETPFDQPITVAAPYGDDIVVRIQ